MLTMMSISILSVSNCTESSFCTLWIFSAAEFVLHSKSLSLKTFKIKSVPEANYGEFSKSYLSYLFGVIPLEYMQNMEGGVTYMRRNIFSDTSMQHVEIASPSYKLHRGLPAGVNMTLTKSINVYSN